MTIRMDLADSPLTGIGLDHKLFTGDIEGFKPVRDQPHRLLQSCIHPSNRRPKTPVFKDRITQ